MSEKNRQLMFVQIDRLDGETAGYLIDQIYASGADNAQLLPSLTKKGRPGYLLMIDVPDDLRGEMERLLVEDFCITGWHLIPSRHVFKETEHKKKRISICGNSHRMTVSVPYKYIQGSNAVILEHDFCVRLRQRIKDEFFSNISLVEVKEKLKSALTLNQSTVFL